jgi:hypothetical protein
MMNDELEPEILSYREFRNRETLLAWHRRRRALETPWGTRGETRDLDRRAVKAPLARSPVPPPRRAV